MSWSLVAGWPVYAPPSPPRGRAPGWSWSRRLGGNSSSEVKMHVVGANQHIGRPGWRESGLIEELRLADAVNNHQRCWELWDLLLYDKVVSEPNITLLLETILYSAAVKNGRIQEAAARCDK